MNFGIEECIQLLNDLMYEVRIKYDYHVKAYQVTAYRNPGDFETCFNSSILVAIRMVFSKVLY